MTLDHFDSESLVGHLRLASGAGADFRNEQPFLIPVIL